jgi:hypothetical protein
MWLLPERIIWNTFHVGSAKKSCYMTLLIYVVCIEYSKREYTTVIYFMRQTKLKQAKHIRNFRYMQSHTYAAPGGA